MFRGLVVGSDPWPLFLYGPPGTGKTCAVLALTDWVDGAVYETASNLGYRHQAQITGRGPAVPWDRWKGDDRAAGACRLFVLDELGTRKLVTDTHYEVVHKLLDMREGHPTIVVSNLTADELSAVYDARIADRLLMGTQFELAGETRRV